MIMQAARVSNYRYWLTVLIYLRLEVGCTLLLNKVRACLAVYPPTTNTQILWGDKTIVHRVAKKTPSALPTPHIAGHKSLT